MTVEGRCYNNNCHANDVHRNMCVKSVEDYLECPKKRDTHTMASVFDDNDDISCLFHVRKILRTPEMANVVKHARKIMRLLDNHKDDPEIKELLADAKNDIEFIQHLNDPVEINPPKKE